MAILFSFSFVLFVCVRLFLNLTQSMSFRLRDPAMIEFFSYPCLRLKVSSRGISYVSGKLPTYPSPKATLTLTSHLRQNVDLAGERVGSRWSVSQKRIMSDPSQAEH